MRRLDTVMDHLVQSVRHLRLPQKQQQQRAWLQGLMCVSGKRPAGLSWL